jgi:hypothetical protein
MIKSPVKVLRTMNGEPAVVLRIPVLIFLSRPGSDDVSCILYIDGISESLIRK